MTTGDNSPLHVTINQHHYGAPDALLEVADQLALAIGAEWEAEAQFRRVNDQNTLPVPWVAPDASLFEDWTYAVSAYGDGPAGVGSGAEDWADGPEDLAATEGGMLQLLDRVPSGRLVVLGEAGSGKTVLLVRLMLDLLARRRTTGRGPVPALLSLASWNPAAEDLRTWFLGQLAISHPGLSARVPGAGADMSLGQALLARHLLMPVLDGLDEIPQSVRGRALDRLNEGLHSGDRLVVAARTDDYRRAVHPTGALSVKLRAAAGVTVGEPSPEAVRRYLEREAGGPSAAADRWAPVLAQLGHASPVGRALRTPLAAAMANDTYNPRPGEGLGALPDPTELCDGRRFPTPEAVTAHLLDATVLVGYRPHPGRARHSRWTADEARRYLTELAKHLEQNVDGSTDFAWWQLRRAAPRRLFVSVFAGTLGADFAVAGWLCTGSWTSLASGAALGLFTGFVAGEAAAADARSGAAVRPPMGRLRWPAALTVGGIALTAMAAGIGFAIAGFTGVLMGCAAVSALATVAVWRAWESGAVAGVPADLTTAAAPGAFLVRDRRIFWAMSAAMGLGWLLAFGLAGLAVGSTVGLGVGLIFAVLFASAGLAESAWGMYAVTKGWLCLAGRLPWRFVGFLVDAHEHRGVLRRVGGVYQFRHAQLQKHLATHR
ncbi:NACHT domain-containing protein [Streptomyces kaempferi]|uniref:NACHT domain-containing protein n=1 Tax=Streptomyces kaempferi TaxID=333725 RepID=A0ABW3XP48_9ACTN